MGKEELIPNPLNSEKCAKVFRVRNAGRSVHIVYGQVRLLMVWSNYDEIVTNRNNYGQFTVTVSLCL